MLDPGSFIAIALVSYSGAVKSWSTFRAAAHFSEDADEIVLRLSLERFRFDLWGRNAGLEQNTFHQSLFPVVELVTKVLDRIKTLFENADELRNRYGLVDDSQAVDEPRRTQKFISRMQNSLRSTRMGVSERIESECTIEKHETSAVLKVRWGMRDKAKFEKLVEDVEKYIEKLNQLLTESQRRSFAEDQARANIAIVGNIIDENSLEVIRKAIEIGMRDQAVSNLVERKAISVQSWKSDADTISAHTHQSNTVQRLRLKDFEMVGDGDFPKRCFARRIETPGDLFFFERKDHPHQTSSSRELVVENRIEQLILLLSIEREDLNTLQAVGYIADRPRSCWWLVFKFPSPDQEAVSLNNSTRPVSLLNLFDSKIMRTKPALEKRLELAYELASTVSGLYSSSWMHKSLRSDNILFPLMYDTGINTTLQVTEISSPLLAGFEYSRQDNESRSLDALKSDGISSVIYRHPLYQGEAASGYRIEYDIYSFGLILVEIGFWQSLGTFLDARVTKSSSDTRRTLSSKAETFDQSDAEELQKRVLYRVESDLAFRMGTAYRDVVRWCLTVADDTHASLMEEYRRGDAVGENSEEWHPALEFYNKVVIPLSQLGRQDIDS